MGRKLLLAALPAVMCVLVAFGLSSLDGVAAKTCVGVPGSGQWQAIGRWTGCSGGPPVGGDTAALSAAGGGVFTLVGTIPSLTIALGNGYTIDFSTYGTPVGTNLTLIPGAGGGTIQSATTAQSLFLASLTPGGAADVLNITGNGQIRWESFSLPNTTTICFKSGNWPGARFRNGIHSSSGHLMVLKANVSTDSASTLMTFQSPFRLTVGAGGTFSLAAGVWKIANPDLSLLGTVVLNATASWEVDHSLSSGTVIFSNGAALRKTITLNDGATLRFNGTLDVGGVISYQSQLATLVISSSPALLNRGGSILFGTTFTVPAGTVLSCPVTVTLGDFFFAPNVAITNTFDVVMYATVNQNSVNSVVSAVTTVDDDAGYLLANGRFSGNVTIGGIAWFSLNGPSTPLFTGNARVTESGEFSTTNGNCTGTVILESGSLVIGGAGNSWYACKTTIQSGTATFSANARIGAASFTHTGGTFTFATGLNILRSASFDLAASGAVIRNFGNNIPGTLTLRGANSHFFQDAAYALNHTGTVSLTNFASFHMAGSKTIFAGALSIGAGCVGNFSAGAVLAVGGTITVQPGGTLYLSSQMLGTVTYSDTGSRVFGDTPIVFGTLILNAGSTTINAGVVAKSIVINSAATVDFTAGWNTGTTSIVLNAGVMNFLSTFSGGSLITIYSAYTGVFAPAGLVIGGQLVIGTGVTFVTADVGCVSTGMVMGSGEWNSVGGTFNGCLIGIFVWRAESSTFYTPSNNIIGCADGTFFTNYVTIVQMGGPFTISTPVTTVATTVFVVAAGTAVTIDNSANFFSAGTEVQLPATSTWTSSGTLSGTFTGLGTYTHNSGTSYVETFTFAGATLFGTLQLKGSSVLTINSGQLSGGMTGGGAASTAQLIVAGATGAVSFAAGYSWGATPQCSFAGTVSFFGPQSVTCVSSVPITDSYIRIVSGVVNFASLSLSAGAILNVGATSMAVINGGVMSSTAQLQSTGGTVNITSMTGTLPSYLNCSISTPVGGFLLNGPLGDATFIGSGCRISRFSVNGTAVVPLGWTVGSNGAISIGAAGSLTLSSGSVLVNGIRSLHPNGYCSIMGNAYGAMQNLAGRFVLALTGSVSGFINITGGSSSIFNSHSQGIAIGGNAVVAIGSSIGGTYTQTGGNVTALGGVWSATTQVTAAARLTFGAVVSIASGVPFTVAGGVLELGGGTTITCGLACPTFTLTGAARLLGPSSGTVTVTGTGVLTLPRASWSQGTISVVAQFSCPFLTMSDTATLQAGIVTVSAASPTSLRGTIRSTGAITVHGGVSGTISCIAAGCISVTVNGATGPLTLNGVSAGTTLYGTMNSTNTVAGVVVVLVNVNVLASVRLITNSTFIMRGIQNTITDNPFQPSYFIVDDDASVKVTGSWSTSSQVVIRSAKLTTNNGATLLFGGGLVMAATSQIVLSDSVSLATSTGNNAVRGSILFGAFGQTNLLGGLAGDLNLTATTSNNLHQLYGNLQNSAPGSVLTLSGIQVTASFLGFNGTDTRVQIAGGASTTTEVYTTSVLSASWPPITILPGGYLRVSGNPTKVPQLTFDSDGLEVVESSTLNVNNLYMGPNAIVNVGALASLLAGRASTRIEGTVLLESFGSQFSLQRGLTGALAVTGSGFITGDWRNSDGCTLTLSGGSVMDSNFKFNGTGSTIQILDYAYVSGPIPANTINPTSITLSPSALLTLQSGGPLILQTVVLGDGAGLSIQIQSTVSNIEMTSQLSNIAVLGTQQFSIGGLVQGTITADSAFAIILGLGVTLIGELRLKGTAYNGLGGTSVGGAFAWTGANRWLFASGVNFFPSFQLTGPAGTNSSLVLTGQNNIGSNIFPDSIQVTGPPNQLLIYGASGTITLRSLSYGGSNTVLIGVGATALNVNLPNITARAGAQFNSTSSGLITIDGKIRGTISCSTAPAGNALLIGTYPNSAPISGGTLTIIGSNFATTALGGDMRGTGASLQATNVVFKSNFQLSGTGSLSTLLGTNTLEAGAQLNTGGVSFTGGTLIVGAPTTSAGTVGVQTLNWIGAANTLWINCAFTVASMNMPTNGFIYLNSSIANLAVSSGAMLGVVAMRATAGSPSVSLGTATVPASSTLDFLANTTNAQFPTVSFATASTHSGVFTVRRGWTVLGGTSMAASSGTLQLMDSTLNGPATILANTVINGAAVTFVRGTGSVTFSSFTLTTGDVTFFVPVLVGTFVGAAASTCNVRTYADLTFMNGTYPNNIILGVAPVAFNISGLSQTTNGLQVIGQPGSTLTGNLRISSTPTSRIRTTNMNHLSTFSCTGTGATMLSIAGQSFFTAPNTINLPMIQVVVTGTGNNVSFVGSGSISIAGLAWVGAAVTVTSGVNLVSSNPQMTISNQLICNGGSVFFGGGLLSTVIAATAPCDLTLSGAQVVGAAGPRLEGLSSSAVLTFRGTFTTPVSATLELRPNTVWESGSKSGPGQIQLSGTTIMSAVVLSGTILGYTTVGITNTFEVPRTLTSLSLDAGTIALFGTGELLLVTATVGASGAVIESLVPTATLSGALALSTASTTCTFRAAIGVSGLSITGVSTAAIHDSSTFFLPAGATLTVTTVKFGLAQTDGPGTLQFPTPYTFSIPSFALIRSGVTFIPGNNVVFSHTSGISYFPGQFTWTNKLVFTGGDINAQLWLDQPRMAAASTSIETDSTRLNITGGYLQGTINAIIGAGVNFYLRSAIVPKGSLSIVTTGGGFSWLLRGSMDLTGETTLSIGGSVVLKEGFKFTGNATGSVVNWLGDSQLYGPVNYNLPGLVFQMTPDLSYVDISCVAPGEIVLPKTVINGIVNIKGQNGVSSACLVNFTDVIGAAPNMLLFNVRELDTPDVYFHAASGQYGLNGQIATSFGATTTMTFGMISGNNLLFTVAVGSRNVLTSRNSTQLTIAGSTQFKGNLILRDLHIAGASTGTVLLDGCTVFSSTNFPAALSISGPVNSAPTTFIASTPTHVIRPLNSWTTTVFIAGSGSVQFAAPGSSGLGTAVLLCESPLVSISGTLVMSLAGQPFQIINCTVASGQTLTLGPGGSGKVAFNNLQNSGHVVLESGTRIGGLPITVSGTGDWRLNGGSAIDGPMTFPLGATVYGPVAGQTATLTTIGVVKILGPFYWEGIIQAGPANLNITDARPTDESSSTIIGGNGKVYIGGGNVLQGSLGGPGQFIITTHLSGTLTLSGSAILAGAMTGDQIIFLVQPATIAANTTIGNNTILSPIIGLYTVTAPISFPGTFTAWIGGTLIINGAGNAHFGLVRVGTGTVLLYSGVTVSGTFSVSNQLNVTNVRVAAGKTLTISGVGTVFGTIIGNLGTVMLTGGVTVDPDFRIVSNTGAFTFSGCTLETLKFLIPAGVELNGPIAPATTTIMMNSLATLTNWTGTVLIPSGNVVTLAAAYPRAGATLTSADNTAILSSSTIYPLPGTLFTLTDVMMNSVTFRPAYVSSTPPQLTGRCVVSGTPGIQLGLGGTDAIDLLPDFSVSGSGTFNCAGTCTIIGPSDSRIAVPLLRSTTGTLIFSSGDIRFGAGLLLRFADSINLVNGATLNVGELVIDTGAAVITADAGTTLAVANCSNWRGTLTGGGTYDVTGILPLSSLLKLSGSARWSSGVINGAGTLQFSGSPMIASAALFAQSILLSGPTLVTDTVSFETPRTLRQTISSLTGTLRLVGLPTGLFSVLSVMQTISSLEGVGTIQASMRCAVCRIGLIPGSALTAAPDVGAGGWSILPLASTGTIDPSSTFSTGTNGVLIFGAGMTIGGNTAITGTGVVAVDGVTFIGPNGLITAPIVSDFGQLTFAGTGTTTLNSLKIGAGGPPQFRVDIQNNLIISGFLKTNTSTAQFRALSASASLTAAAGTISGTLYGPGSFTLGSGVDIDRQLTVTGNATVMGSLSTSTGASLILQGGIIGSRATTDVPNLPIVIPINQNGTILTPQSLFTLQSWSGSLFASGGAQLALVDAVALGTAAVLNTVDPTGVSGDVTVAANGILRIRSAAVMVGTSFAIAAPNNGSVAGFGTGSGFTLPADAALVIGSGVRLDTSLAIGGAGALYVTDNVLISGPRSNLNAGSMFGPPAGRVLTLIGTGAVTLSRLSWSGRLRIRGPTRLDLVLTPAFGPSADAILFAESAQPTVVTFAGAGDTVQGLLNCSADTSTTYIVNTGLAAGGITVDGNSLLTGTITAVTDRVINLRNARIANDIVLPLFVTYAGPASGYVAAFQVPALISTAFTSIAGTVRASGIGSLQFFQPVTSVFGSRFESGGGDIYFGAGGFLTSYFAAAGGVFRFDSVLFGAATEFAVSVTGGVASFDSCQVPSGVKWNAAYEVEVRTNSTFGGLDSVGAAVRVNRLTLLAGAYISVDTIGGLVVTNLTVDAPAGFIAPPPATAAAPMHKLTVTGLNAFNMHSPVSFESMAVTFTSEWRINTVNGVQSIVMSAGSTITTYAGIAVSRTGTNSPPSQLLFTNGDGAAERLTLWNSKSFTLIAPIHTANTSVILDTCVNGTSGLLPLVPDVSVYPPSNCDVTDLFSACLSSPCDAVGSFQCNAYQSEYTCTCHPGYSGRRCETEINECASTPCRNGGTCVDLINSYHCDCLGTFFGAACEGDVNECATNNGGCDLTYSVCTNSFGAFNCSSYIAPGSFAPEAQSAVTSTDPFVFADTAGGQVLYFVLSAPFQDAASLGIGIGPANEPLRFRASTLQVINSSDSRAQLIRCELPDISGVGMNVSLILVPSQSSQHPIIIFTTKQTISTPLPIITPMSVRLNITGQDNTPTAQLYVNSNAPVPIQFDVRYIVLHRTDLLFVYYGPVSNPRRFGCAILPDQLTANTITCLTALNSKGLANSVTLVVADAALTGTDLIDFPIFPTVLAVSGCPPAGCPTEGGTLMLINGTDFSNQMNVFVAGNIRCTNVVVYDDTSASCILPPGTGQRRPLTVTSYQFTSVPLNVISYAYPTVSTVTGCTDVQPANASTVDCARFGQVRITVTGINFGESGAVVLVGSSLCAAAVQDVALTPHRRITCTIPAAVTRYSIIGLPVLVIQSGGVSSGAVSISYKQCDTGFQAVGLNCVPCASGFVSTIKDAQACSTCPAGTYSGAAPSSACVQCPKGTASVAGVTACTNCTAGRAAAALGLSECTPCGQGEYSSLNGSASCSGCASGHYQNRLGQTACIECATGSATASTKQTLCVTCDRGSFSAANGSLQCESCPLGTFQPSIGASFCSPCGEGASSPGRGQSACDLCERGQYGSNSLCLDCPGGTVQPIRGGNGCVKCPVGFYSPPRSSECVQCAIGFMAPRPGSEGCTGCPAGSKSDGDTRVLCKCLVATYATTDDIDMKCEPCPTGAICDADGVTVATMLADGGYWRSDNASLDYYVCLQKDACLAGGECALNRVGPLCAVCRNGYRQDTSGQTCSICPARDSAIGGSIGFTILIIAALLIIFSVMWHSEGKLIPKHDIFKKVKAFSAEDRVPPDYTYNFKLLLGYLQVATSLLALADIPWPTYFTTFIHSFDFVNLDIVPWGSVECVASLTFYDKLLLYAIVPPVIVTLLALIPYTILVIQDRMDLSDAPEHRIALKLRRRKVRKMVVFALFLMYPTISSRVLSFFVCREVNGVRYLAADFHLQCNTDDWNRSVPLAVACVLVYPFGIPAAVFVILFRNRHRLKIPDTQAAYGLLYEAYQPRFWYFELIDIIAKLMLTSLLQFLEPAARLSVGLVVCTCYLWIILLLGPYTRRIDDRLAQFIQIQLYGILLMGATLQNVTFIRESKEDMLGSVVLLIILFGLIVICIYHAILFIRNWLRNYQRRRNLAKEVTMEDNIMLHAPLPKIPDSRRGTEAGGEPSSVVSGSGGAHSDTFEHPPDEHDAIAAPKVETGKAGDHGAHHMNRRGSMAYREAHMSNEALLSRFRETGGSANPSVDFSVAGSLTISPSALSQSRGSIDSTSHSEPPLLPAIDIVPAAVHAPSASIELTNFESSPTAPMLPVPILAPVATLAPPPPPTADMPPPPPPLSPVASAAPALDFSAALASSTSAAPQLPVLSSAASAETTPSPAAVPSP